MTVEEANQVIRVLSTDGRVFGLGVDTLIREAGNCMTAGALFRFLATLDVSSPDFEEKLSAWIAEMGVGDPSMLIGHDDGRWVDLPEGAEGEEELEDGNTVSRYLRVVHVSEEASFYLFHPGSRILDGSYVRGGARKREGAIHHVKVELSEARFLQQVVTRARECPHVVRVEESTEEVFWAAPSHSPGY